jgi:hypothetical protein
MAARAIPAMTSEQRRIVAPTRGINPTYRDMQPVNIPGYHCNVRVYPSLNWAFEPRTPGDQKDYLEHNRTLRPGCAIFVDGELVEASWLEGQPEQAEAIARRLKKYQTPCSGHTLRMLPQL